MKLSDIDVIVEHRKVYIAKRDELLHSKRDRIAGILYQSNHVFRDMRLEYLLSDTVTAFLQKEYDEAKTKLMMLGVTEFPD